MRALRAQRINGIEVIGASESTYLPGHDKDIVETTGHDRYWRQDLELLAAAGVRRLRYPVRWHRMEAEEGAYDWSETDRILNHFHDCSFSPIVDLVHHTSYPRWLTATWLKGYLPQMRHWTWSPRPETDQGTGLPKETTRIELRIVDAH